MSDAKQLALFDDRFLESYAGKGIINDKKIAIIELIANSWDAGATEVRVIWPLSQGDSFSVSDNGHGMTENEFNNRYRVLAYNRQKNQGTAAEIPEDNRARIGSRSAFGRNGKGRLAGFAFGEIFQVKTWKNGEENHYKVFRDNTNILAFNKLGSNPRPGHGTEVFIENAIPTIISADEIKTEIGMRFLVDPNFSVLVNNSKVGHSDIPAENISEFHVAIEGEDPIKVIVIDVKATDRSTQQHGVAWHVQNRLVGECTWKGTSNEDLIDGRRSVAKRYAFIVKADCLINSVLPDWSDFLRSDSLFQRVYTAVHAKIKEFILDLYRANRDETFRGIESAVRPALNNMSLVAREKWESAVSAIQEECPSISETDLEKVATLLAKLEQSDSKYGLIDFLSSSSIDDLDSLNEILQKWNIDFAKVVLDELENRMRLIEKLQARVRIDSTDEVHELQPLFHRGLWIFGPEYETIEYTSNVGMTTVIQDLFGVDMKGSKNRPDFAIMRDSSVGLYGLYKYDDEGAEIEIDRLTIVELKRPSVPIKLDEINQAWKYVTELLDRGLLTKNSRVICFVLGKHIDPSETGGTTKNEGKVVIRPLTYDTVLKRAKSRLLNLLDKVKNSPFLKETRISEYMREREQAAISQLMLALPAPQSEVIVSSPVTTEAD